MNKLKLIVLCAFAAFCSCKKDAADNTGVSFNNRLDKQVTLTVYPTMADYSNGTNAVTRKTVKAGEILVLPGSTFVTGRTYYMDWFTDDYYTNNWFSDAYPQTGSQVAIKPVAGNNTLYLEPGFTGYSRKVFLKNDDLSSSWHAIDAYMYSTGTGYKSFWASLSDFDRYRHVKVTKGFIAAYDHKNGVGNILSDTLSFKVQHSEDAYIEFMNGNTGKIIGSMATGILPTGVAPDYKSTSKDTVLATFPNSDYYFMMIRD